MPNNQPISTNPLFASDEKVAIRARGDFINLTTSSEQLADGNDGVIAANSFTELTSATIDFEGQGVTPQCVAVLEVPGAKGSSRVRMFAVDSVFPNTMVLRTINMPLGVGQPPVGAAGATGIKFTVNTFASLIEDASWDLKNRFAIDEAQTFRASSWIYQGVEDEFRDLRAACVLQVLVKAFTAEARSEKGDWERKLGVVKAEYRDVLDRLQIRFGPYGDSQEPTTIFSCKITR